MPAAPAIDPAVRSFAGATFGDRVAPDGSPVAHNFLAWFGTSVAVGPDMAPATFHHGTGNTLGILQRGFAYDLAGIGNDGLGPGWYFTNRLATAKGYSVPRLEPELVKLGGEASPGVLDVFLSLRNPIRTSHAHGTSWFEALPDLNARQARALLLAAPTIRDPDDVLSNWGDVRHLGFDRLLAKAADAYLGPSHFTIFNDFFRGQVEAFLAALHKVTGFDGVMHTFETGEVHAVAWFPHQVKATANNGLFDTRCNDILDAQSPRMQGALPIAPSEPISSLRRSRLGGEQKARRARQAQAVVASALAMPMASARP